MQEGLSEKLFIDRICKESKAGEKFCFILGAGASWSSGIPTGRDLMRKWRTELGKEEEHNPGYLDALCQHAGLPPEEFDRIVRSKEEPNSEDYFALYDLRFDGKPVEAAQYLENAMANKFPSCGHCFLATFLNRTHNRLVITTNFDSLVEDALFIYHSTHPRVLGHESLAPFLSSNSQRPVVAKIHRDLFLGPKNREKELQDLEEAWKAPLTKVLSEYIPIVIGYGGGDQTLMSLLERIDLRGIYWCLRNERPSERVRKILEKSHGEWVPILGFDELLFQMNERYPYEGELGDPCQHIQTVANERCKKFQEHLGKVKAQYGVTRKESFVKSSVDTTGVMTAVAQYEERSERSAGPQSEVEVRISAIRLELAKNHSQKAVVLCTQALQDHPNECRLYDLRGTAYYRLEEYESALIDEGKAIQLDPKNQKFYSRRGEILIVMGRYEEALEDYHQAICLAPEDEWPYVYRGSILCAMKRYEEALEDYNRAIQLNPECMWYYKSRAIILRALGREEEAQQDEETAESL